MEGTPAHWDSQQTVNLRMLLMVLFKHRNKIAAFFFATVILVTLVTLLLPPVYEAKSSLLVKLGREYFNLAEGSNNIPLVSQDEAVNSEVKIITNPELVDEVITAIGIAKLYPELVQNPPARMTLMQAAGMEFTKNFSAEAVKKSNVIEVYFRHKTPELAAETLNILVDLYREQHLRIFSDRKSSFMQSQLLFLEEKLTRSERDLETFKQKNRVFSLDEQRTLLLKQRADFDSTLRETANRISELVARTATLKGLASNLVKDKGLYTPTEIDKVLVEAKARLLGLQLREKELSQEYSENSRLVSDIRAQIGIVQGFLIDQESDSLAGAKRGNRVYQEIVTDIVRSEAELKSQRARGDTLKKQITDFDEEIRALDLRETEFEALRRTVAINEKNFNTYVDKLESARLTDTMDHQKMANVSVIHGASVPAKPIKPKKAVNILMGIVLGALGAICFAFLLEFTSDRISTPRDVETRLQVPVLAAVSYSKADRKSRARQENSGEMVFSEHNT